MTLEEAILRAISHKMRLSIGDICTVGRTRDVVMARQIGYYLYRKVYLSPTPLSKISFVLFGLFHDHGTVIHNIKAIEAFIQTEKTTGNLVSEIKSQVDSLIVEVSPSEKIDFLYDKIFNNAPYSNVPQL